MLEESRLPSKALVEYRQRYFRRYVVAPPSKALVSAPESPGSETSRFQKRRDEEGEATFARELWIAIRNNHHMRGCWCGPPNIYNSREEAEVASGHLRFYVAGEEKSLRVLQKKDDFHWQHAVYKDLVNGNGKRPAEDSEVELIAQDLGSNRGSSVERVFPALIEAAPAQGKEENSPTPQSNAQEITSHETPAPAQSMWSQTRGIFSRAIATMTNPVTTLFDRLWAQVRASAHEIVDLRTYNAETHAIIVKRIKRQATGLSIDEAPRDNGKDTFDDLVWTDDPMKRIGYERLEALAKAFAEQLESINAKNVIGGSSIDHIRTKIKDGQDLATSVCLHVYHRSRFAKMLTTLQYYQELLGKAIKFMQNVYNLDTVELLKEEYSSPPRRLTLGNSRDRQAYSMLGRFLLFFRTLNDHCSLDPNILEAICQVIADVNAAHKQEMLPSWVDVPNDPTEGMPGFFPDDREPVMEEIPAEDLHIEPIWDFRFPGEEPSVPEQTPGEPGDYKLVTKPKGILKPSKPFEAPPSPRYVATPDKKRKLGFKNPVSKFQPPAHIPAKVMTELEAEQIDAARLRAEAVGDEYSVRMFEASTTVSRRRDLARASEVKTSSEAVERDDKEMGLVYHARKYEPFLNDLRDDLEKLVEQDQENRNKPALNLTPQRRMLQIALPPLPATPEHRQLLIAQVAGNNSSSPAVPTPAVNPLMPFPEESPLKPLPTKAKPTSVEEFFAQDDVAEDLAIATAKLDQLHVDCQLEHEFKTWAKRDIEEKRRRRAEEERRRAHEERRRQEQQRQREQEARRRKEAEQFAALTGLRQPSRPLITPLSGNWDTRVCNAARANPAAELVKTLEGQPLTRRDFEEMLLPPTAWLNDNVIIGSILHVADSVNTANGATNQEPKCAAFTSYFWPRLVSHGPGGCARLLRRAGVRKANLLDIDTILIPICDQSHWTLAAIRPGRRTVAHIDSMRGGRGDPAVKNKLLELVRFILEDEFVADDWTAVDYEAPRQTNGWDCGVFTITNAMCMALGLNPKFAYTERELTLQRRRLAAVLLNEGFKGEFSLDGF
ncbi:hypothetical protein N0V88_000439 [Collariella sp. IMI 366227]|nr:hypothetical protein N0V88_000439 [Collariella sp. IMI 366227]